MVESNPYRQIEGNVEPILETVQQQIEEDDLLYISGRMVPFISFYLTEKPENYYYAENCVDDTPDECFQSIVDLPILTENGADRIWLLVTEGRSSILAELRNWEDKGIADIIDVDKSFNLYLLNDKSPVISERMKIAQHRVEAYQSVASTEPAINSYFNIYINTRTLIYVRERCEPVDTDARFFLHIVPKDANDLNIRRQEVGFDNLSFNFSRYSIKYKNKCIAVVPLPDYPIDNLRTGQHDYEYELNLWDETYNFGLPEILDTLFHLQQTGHEPLIRSNFTVYMHNNRLIYAKPSCADHDHDTRFFIHIEPVFIDDLPEHRKQFGFDNIGFSLIDQGGRYKWQCVASVDLPQYPIAEIRTGQFTPEGQIWNGRIDVRANININEAYSSQYDAIESITPLAESEFDIRLVDDDLTYSKQPCTSKDTNHPFFLHITPLDLDQLPEDRIQHGFDNLDFEFHINGTIFDDKCIAKIDLPDYHIRSIRTGQWIRERGEILWAAEIPFTR